MTPKETADGIYKAIENKVRREVAEEIINTISEANEVEMMGGRGRNDYIYALNNVKEYIKDTYLKEKGKCVNQQKKEYVIVKE